MLAALVGMAGMVNATVHVAVSGSLADVRTKVALTVDGDTVIIPETASATWSGTLFVTNGITIIGTNVHIKMDLSTNHLIRFTLINSGSTGRLSGLTFPTAASTPVYQVVNWNGPNDRYVRLDNLTFSNVGPVGAILPYAAKGVMDHCLVINSNITGFLGFIKGNNWNGSSWGDGAWATNLNFGTEDFFFFENNIFTNQGVNHVTMMDCQAGGRYVFRHNKVYRCSVESHGLEAARERSGHAFEIYANTFDGIDTQSTVTYARGGSALVYSNYVNGYGATPTLHLLNNRLLDHLGAPFGIADGRNPFDTNDPANPHDSGTMSSAGANTMTDSSKTWEVNQWAGFILRHTNGKTITSMERSGTTVTVDTSASHGFVNGDYVSIIGANQQAYNSVYQITKTDDDTFTFQNSWEPVTPSTGTRYAIANNSSAEIYSNTEDTITFGSSIFGSALTMEFGANDTYEINNIIHAMDAPGRTGGTNYAGASNPTSANGGNPQITSPWYEWQNIKTTSAPATIGGAGTVFTFATLPRKLIVPGVHFTNAVFSYTAYVYPHPMVSGVEPSLPTPRISSRAPQRGRLRR